MHIILRYSVAITSRDTANHHLAEDTRTEQFLGPASQSHDLSVFICLSQPFALARSSHEISSFQSRFLPGEPRMMPRESLPRRLMSELGGKEFRPFRRDREADASTGFRAQGRMGGLRAHTSTAWSARYVARLSPSDPAREPVGWPSSSSPIGLGRRSRIAALAGCHSQKFIGVALLQLSATHFKGTVYPCDQASSFLHLGIQFARPTCYIGPAPET